MNLILDMDGTLINHYGKKRPYLKEFLEYCFSNFKTVSLWSSATRKWIDMVLKEILSDDMKLFFIFDERRCTIVADFDIDSFYPESVSIKPLKKLFRRHKEFNKKNTLIIDNTPETYYRNYGNAIPIKSYEEEDDDMLKRLIVYLDILLEKFNNGEDITRIEKRYWHLYIHS